MDTIEEAIQIYNEITKITAFAGIPLRKRSFN